MTGRGGDQPPAMPTQNCAVCGARRPRRATVPRFDLVILRPQAEESAFPSPNAPSSVICSANATFPPEGGRFYQARLGSRAPQSQVPRCHGWRAESSRPTLSAPRVILSAAKDPSLPSFEAASGDERTDSSPSAQNDGERRCAVRFTPSVRLRRTAPPSRGSDAGWRAESSRPMDGAVSCRAPHHTQMLPVENPVENVQTFVRRERRPKMGPERFTNL